MTKLLEHFKAMQAMAGRYLEPGPYTDHRGAEFSSVEDASVGFITDMVYMLDGPEQRAAEAADAQAAEEAQAQRGVEAAAWRDQADILEASNRELADKRAVAEADAKRAIAKLDAERVVNNDLRDRLMASELAYAKLVGYLEGKREAEPPQMVPAPRDTFMAAMPDASRGTSGMVTDTYGRFTNAKMWYHR